MMDTLHLRLKTVKCQGRKKPKLGFSRFWIKLGFSEFKTSPLTEHRDKNFPLPAISESLCYQAVNSCCQPRKVKIGVVCSKDHFFMRRLRDRVCRLGCLRHRTFHRTSQVPWILSFALTSSRTCHHNIVESYEGGEKALKISINHLLLKLLHLFGGHFRHQARHSSGSTCPLQWSGLSICRCLRTLLCRHRGHILHSCVTCVHLHRWHTPRLLSW